MRCHVTGSGGDYSPEPLVKGSLASPETPLKWICSDCASYQHPDFSVKSMCCLELVFEAASSLKFTDRNAFKSDTSLTVPTEQCESIFTQHLKAILMIYFHF